MIREAMVDLTAWVFAKRRIGHPKPSRSLVDHINRGAALHVLLCLKRNGYEVQPHDVRRWADANGWPEGETQLLADYATGVQAGVRYHADPDPGFDIDDWRRRAWAKEQKG